MKLSELANLTGASFEGTDVEISDIATLDNAKKGDITFLFNKKYAPLLATTKASAVILPDFAPSIPLPSLRSKNPHLLYAKVMNEFKKIDHPACEVSASAHISENVELGKDVYIGPFVYVGPKVKIADGVKIYPNVTILDEVSIGKNTIIYSQVCIREKVQLGANVIVQPGAVIGSDGFGFAKDDSGAYKKIPHTGGVIIEDDVEIGASSMIDRASFGDTIIRRGVKIDNLVHVAHSVEVGENTLLIAQVGIAGSSKIGANTILAGKTAVSGHIRIGDNVTSAPVSGIHHDIDDNSVVAGIPAIDASLWKRAVIAFKKLPEFARDIRKIKKHLDLKD